MSALRQVQPTRVLPSWLTECLESFGLEYLGRYLRCEERPALFPHQPVRGNLTMGFHDGRRFHEVAMRDCYRYSDLQSFVRDQQELGRFLVSGVRAMPEIYRPKLPGWAYEAALADRNRGYLKRASRLADQAARGRFVPAGPAHEDNLSLPF